MQTNTDEEPMIVHRGYPIKTLTPDVPRPEPEVIYVTPPEPVVQSSTSPNSSPRFPHPNLYRHRQQIKRVQAKLALFRF